MGPDSGPIGSCRILWNVRRAMKLKKSYTFLYMPEDHGASRQFRIPRWVVASCVGILGALTLCTALYAVSVRTGNGWLPGGSHLQRENRAMADQIATLESGMGALRGEIDHVYALQQLVAGTVNLPVADPETFAAGIGGRGGTLKLDPEIPSLDRVLDGSGGFHELEQDLQHMVRQAKIQRRGYQAMLDTLSVREAVRRKVPTIRPVDTGWVSSRFGLREDPFTQQQRFHRGLDFSVPTGTPVRVTGDGVVFRVEKQRGLGNVVKIDHGDGVMTVYAHLSQARVKKGQHVRRGEVIALSGNTGRSTASHLHYEVRIGGRSVNPLPYILDAFAARD